MTVAAYGVARDFAETAGPGGQPPRGLNLPQLAARRFSVG
jgi:hypothetical protein